MVIAGVEESKKPHLTVFGVAATVIAVSSILCLPGLLKPADRCVKPDQRLPFDPDLLGAREDFVAEPFFQAAPLGEVTGRGVFDDQRRMRRGHARRGVQRDAIGIGSAAVDDELSRRQAAAPVRRRRTSRPRGRESAGACL